MMLSGQFQRFAVLIAVVCLMYGNVLYSAPAHPETAPDQLPDDILKRNADQTNHVHDPAKDKRCNKGEAWYEGNDPCFGCYCYTQGKYVCGKRTCKYRCKQPRLLNETCCGVCADCELGGGYFAKSGTMNIFMGKICLCDDGKMTCEANNRTVIL